MDAAIQREQVLFDAALELSDPARRRAFLHEACANEPELRTRVEGLLAVHTDADQFFAEYAPTLAAFANDLPVAVSHAQTSAEPVAEDDILPSEEQPGTFIGRYKLLERLGEGGCGAVYMAQQEQPVKRRVALKIIKLGMDTRAVIARFEAERQALAMMDHPNIARVLDVGATETGRPYFVMDLVRGIKITEYCDQNHLDVRQRLDLFVQTCHAIQHAHQKGIIHRDIKPSNILVTIHDGAPVPKVIDFGVAKATAQHLTDKTPFTSFGQFIGTPAYMSPEQAEMGNPDVDTRSDIYSLGVVLYELLTGRTPFDSKELLQSGLDEMRRTLREKEPHRPSTRLNTLQGEELTRTAQHRQAEPRKLGSLLRGDLDWIVMKALDKDRQRRYETANGLALDIQRYLANEPVVARPPSRLYRFRKLVRRNRGVFAAAGAVVLALLIGLGTSTWLFLKEKDLEHTQARLRQEAEIREQVTKAALLISQGKFEDADKLAGGIPLDKPTLDGAAVLRSLGEWCALSGRWKPAAGHFKRLLQINQLDGWDISTLDSLAGGAVLAEVGDTAEFDLFRRKISGRFSDTSNPMAAQRLLKASLLLPPGETALEALKPLARAMIPSAPVSVGSPVPAVASWQQNPSGNIRAAPEKMLLHEGVPDNGPADPGAASKEPIRLAPPAMDNLVQRLELRNIGTEQPRSLSFQDGFVTIVGGGGDIWQSLDQFAYASTAVAGDFDYRMRVHSISPRLDDFTRVGLMARESLDRVGSRNVLVAVNAGNTFQVVTRSEENAFTASVPQNPLPVAYGSNSWVRLQRVGAIFHAYGSSNGVDWVQLYQTTGGDKPFADPIYFGIAANAHSSKSVATNVLSDLGVTPTVSVNVAVTLALMEYRQGHFEKSADWCRRSLAYPECDAVQSSTAQLVLALACARLRQTEDARTHLERGRDLVKKQFAEGLNPGSPREGFWFEWVAARVLLKEADALLAGQSSGDPL